ncbi:unnamed protein product [Didymodactylos carnosus]|uniref:Uncharacterized protein n=1 Tax=Didymodactylos carnosus TaxID=1234261 RepID=A0A814BCB4_9BILA|nr:unnamed protein product [Didymodactylos carnosus]CAF1597947.1 unnamed protein product [Didymodactylos carnosus]CAF3705707.1 unnamed protein product [Didymodactylos carnosus]CAF4405089.1 unnamed protein product [Didymodactylos carnosus]
MNKPAQIWNVDESGFNDDPGGKSAVVKRDTEHPNLIYGSSGKSQTRFFCALRPADALDNDIHILTLPPHTTHALQPSDVYTLKNCQNRLASYIT